MKIIWLIMGIFILGASSAFAFDNSLVVNEANLHYGDTVTFTAIYPKEATRKIGSRQHDNPDVLISCTQNGIQVYSQTTGFFGNETNNKDGSITGISYPRTLGGNSGNGIVWDSGAANCSAVLYYFGHDGQIHFLANTSFDVSA